MAYSDVTFAPQIEYQEGESVEAAIGYLQSVWNRFLGLSSAIIDLQHRAAVASADARAAGNDFLADQARAVIYALRDLQSAHNWATSKIETVASWVGLSSYRRVPGLGAIPAAQVTIITTVALVVVWFFRSFAAQERKLELIEAGVLTAEEAAQLETGPAPAAVLGSIAELGKLVLVGFGLWIAWQMLATWRSNPPQLQVFDVNPPDELFGEEVYAVWYRHADDDNPYVHEFGRGVVMQAERDGTVTLRHRGGKPLWREF